MMNAILEGCILRSPTEWPGLVELVGVSSAEQWQLIEKMPGIYRYGGNPHKNIAPGIYLPQSLIDLGKWPGGLYGYKPDAALASPSGRPLREHQRRAITFLRCVTPQREGAILGAAMGLGKCTISLQANLLDGLLEQPGIICGPLPSAAAWCGPKADATVHYGLSIHRLTGKKNIDPSVLAEHKHVYINYDILDAWFVWLCQMNPAWIIFDESHKLIHARSSRSEAALKISRWHTIQRRIALSGTPIPKNRMDLWNQLCVVQPRQWGTNVFDYGVRYRNGHREMAAGKEGDEREYYVYDEDTHTLELRSRLAGTILWYGKKEAGTDLPTLTRTVIDMYPKPDDIPGYYEASTDILGYLKGRGEWAEGGKEEVGGETVDVKPEKPSALRLRALGKLVGLLSSYKAHESLNIILKALANHDRLVVFTWRRESAAYIFDQLAAMVGHAKGQPEAAGTDKTRMPQIMGPIDGSMKQKKRQALAEEFAETPCAVYVATLGAAGESINELAAASCVIFVDLHWNPHVLSQAESRIERDGSAYDEIESIFMLAHGTVDDLYLRHLLAKAASGTNIKPDEEENAFLVGDLVAASAPTQQQSVDDICALLAEIGDNEL